jgi:hypothetical protein
MSGQQDGFADTSHGSWITLHSHVNTAVTSDSVMQQHHALCQELLMFVTDCFIV